MSFRSVQIGFPRPIVATTCLATLLVLLAFGAPAARADTTLTVNTTSGGDSGHCAPDAQCSLRDALELIDEGEVSGDVTIDFSVTGTIELGEEELELEPAEEVGAVRIEGPGAGRLTLDGEGETRVLSVEGPGWVLISGLTIAHGAATDIGTAGGGGIRVVETALNLESVDVVENEARSLRPGGGIAVEGGASLSLQGCRVRKNSSGFRDGGGVFIDTQNSNTIEDTLFEENTTAEGRGGAIALAEGDLAIGGSTLERNAAAEDGGGLYADGEGEVGLFEDKVLRNASHGEGGGLAVKIPLRMEGTYVAENETEEEGGGIWIKDEDATIETSTIAGNFGPEGAAGILDSGDAVLHLRTSTVAENHGTAIDSPSGRVMVENSTIARNGGPGVKGGDIYMQSSILVENSYAEGQVECEGSVTGEGHNIVWQQTPPCDWERGPEEEFGTDPDLEYLGPYGGPTPTMPPRSRESPAINHGSEPAATDQRGRTRPVPAGPANTDVGAVEVQAPVAETAPTLRHDSLREGEELTCDVGSWNTDTIEDATTEVAWLVEGAWAGGGRHFLLERSDAGKQILCEVTVDDGAAAVSARTEAVEMRPAEPVFRSPTVDLGSRPVGSGMGGAGLVVLENKGDAAFEVTGISETDPAEFPSYEETCRGEVILPTEGCYFSLGFAPEAAGERSSTITVQTDVGEFSATAVGSGYVPDLKFDPSTVEFGPQALGTVSGAREVDVRNEGSERLELDGWSLSGAADFAAESGTCSGYLYGGEECAIEVTFAPAALGRREATLALRGLGPISIPLVGIGGAPAFAAIPSAVEFGPQAVGTTSAPAVVAISDSGTTPMAVGAIDLTGAGATAFKLSDGGCEDSVLAPGEACDLQITFAPTALGPSSATITVGGAVPGTIPVSGIAVEAPTPATEPSNSGTGPAPSGTELSPPAATEAPSWIPAPRAPKLMLRPGPFRVGPGGTVRFRLRCPSAGAACHGRVALLRAVGEKGLPRVLGRWSALVPAATGAVATVHLGDVARAALAARGRLPFVLVVSGSGDPIRHRLVLSAPLPET